MIRIVLPQHLRTLARIDGEAHIEANGARSISTLLDLLEDQYPVLRGTIRDHSTKMRRPLVRFFACGEDISDRSAEWSLPTEIVNGLEPFFIVGAIAGG